MFVGKLNGMCEHQPQLLHAARDKTGKKLVCKGSPSVFLNTSVVLFFKAVGLVWDERFDTLSHSPTIITRLSAC